MEILTVRATHALEEALFRRIDRFEVMRAAGGAVAERVQMRLQQRASSRPRILVVAGAGNNGGDAFIVAEELARRFFDVTLLSLVAEKKASEEAARARNRCQPYIDNQQIRAIELSREADIHALFDKHLSQHFDVVVDGLFGIGLNRPLDKRYIDIIAQINDIDAAHTVAIDIPSGISADTGSRLGGAVRADETVSFFTRKIGHCTGDGLEHCGQVHIAPLGVTAADRTEDDPGEIGRYLASPRPRYPRRRNSHKGTFGRALVIGGNRGMTGAAMLASRAAVRLGAGRVSVLSPCPLPVDPIAPEVLWYPDPSHEAIESYRASAILIGPGLSTDAIAGEWIEIALRQPCPIIGDADALNVIAADARLQKLFAEREHPNIITPHPAEAARLLQTDTDEVNRDRLSAARALCAQMRTIAVLKGAGSIIVDGAEPQWAISEAGSAGLAQAGSGDVLAGMMLGLLAQSPDRPYHVACDAVSLHAAAAGVLAKSQGEIGLNLNDIAAVAANMIES